MEGSASEASILMQVLPQSTNYHHKRMLWNLKLMDQFNPWPEQNQQKLPPNSVSQTYNKTEAALETSWFSKKIWPWKEFTKSRSVFCVTGKMKCCVTSSFEGMYSACYHAPVKTTVPELGKVRAAVCCALLFLIDLAQRQPAQKPSVSNYSTISSKVI